MKASTREEAAKWVEVLKELQSMEIDDGRNTTAGAESPHANMVRNAEGTQSAANGGSSSWAKDSGCAGLFRMCMCWK